MKILPIHLKQTIFASITVYVTKLMIVIYILDECHSDHAAAQITLTVAITYMHINKRIIYSNSDAWYKATDDHVATYKDTVDYVLRNIKYDY